MCHVPDYASSLVSKLEDAWHGTFSVTNRALKMSKLKQLETFVEVAKRASLTAAAQFEGVAPAMIGRRIDALEERLGVKLLVRTTRRVSLTREGSSFLEDCQRLLSDLSDAEAAVTEGGGKPTGVLNITAPAGFGRRHVAPQVPIFRSMYPQVKISLNLSDRVLDLSAEGYDCAVRVGEMADSSMVSVRLADNRRMCVASPDFLKRHGVPQHPSELSAFDCLLLSSEAAQLRGWAFSVLQGDKNETMRFKPTRGLSCSDGEVLFDWCLSGHGIAWRSTWEVQAQVKAGKLVPVLEDFAAPSNGIYVVFPQRKHLPLRVRLWVDHLKHTYANPDYWHCA